MSEACVKKKQRKELTEWRQSRMRGGGRVASVSALVLVLTDGSHMETSPAAAPSLKWI